MFAKLKSLAKKIREISELFEKNSYIQNAFKRIKNSERKHAVLAELIKLSEEDSINALASAVNTPHTPLYKALNTHTSVFKCTLYGPGGFFKRTTLSLQRSQQHFEQRRLQRSM